MARDFGFCELGTSRSAQGYDDMDVLDHGISTTGPDVLETPYSSLTLDSLLS